MNESDQPRTLHLLPDVREQDGGPSRPASGRLSTVRALFDPYQLQVARHLARMRKTEVAAGVGVTATAVGQYESGASTPSTEVLSRLALHLGVPVEFFSRPPRRPIHDGAPNFRSLRATTQLERNQATAFGELVWQVAEGLTRWVKLPAVDLPVIPVAVDAPPRDVEAAAKETREYFEVGDDPIAHIVRLAESRGVVAVVTPERLSPRVDAFSHWISGRPIMMLSPAKGDAARSRFDAAHEMGHLVMHHDSEPGSQLRERQAHLFASCLIAPPARLADELPARVDWSRLTELKSYWGMSLKALAFAAHRMGKWGDSTYRTAMTQYNAHSWNHAEPVPLGDVERPAVLGKAMELLRRHDVGVDALVAASGTPAALVDEVVSAGTDQPRFDLE